MAHTIDLDVGATEFKISCGVANVEYTVPCKAGIIPQSEILEQLTHRTCPGCGESLSYILFGME